MLQRNEFKIKNPSGIVQMLGFIIMLVMLLMSVILDTRHDNSISLLTYVRYGAILLIFIALVINIIGHL